MTAIARVYVNNIEVGSLPAEQYKNIVGNVKNDWRVYVLQISNLLTVFLNFSITTLRVAFVIVVVGLSAMLLWEPEAVIQTGKALSTATPADISQGFRKLLLVACTLSTMAVGLVSAFSGFWKYGFVNYFDGRINNVIRSLLEVPAEGNMTVVIESHE